MLAYGMKDKIVMLTGGSRGIGLEIARALPAEKARVVICARKQEGFDNASRSLGGGENLVVDGGADVV